MSGTNSQVNIIAVVDVIGALSIKSLQDGNLCMVDDGSFNSSHQGTANLVTVVKPGQTVSWTALAVDLQTPVEIKNISFIPGNGLTGSPVAGQPQAGAYGQGAQGAPGTQVAGAYGQGAQGTPGTQTPGAYGQGAYGQGAQGHGAQGQTAGDPASAKLDLDVWTGIVPNWMARGVPYHYRLEVQMYDGPDSIMHIDSPALVCQ
ncbi:hypothetical protein ACFWZ2_25955 [Streptomyces sp. NPDC059002]|uniref:hypothetical protein n=1 Tax=Streptomyces sp. NPDC059002 TaxID=3346690 RepID=UPI0036AC6726